MKAGGNERDSNKAALGARNRHDGENNYFLTIAP